MSKKNLFKCGRCKAFREESQFGIKTDGTRMRSCVYCTQKAQLSVRDERMTIVARECGVCGKSIDHPNSKRGWLCKQHAGTVKNTEVKRYVSVCNTCPHMNRCDQRINRGLWVLCELPGAGDIDRVRAMLQDQSMTTEQVIKMTRESY